MTGRAAILVYTYLSVMTTGRGKPRPKSTALELLVPVELLAFRHPRGESLGYVGGTRFIEGCCVVEVLSQVVLAVGVSEHTLQCKVSCSARQEVGPLLHVKHELVKSLCGCTF